MPSPAPETRDRYRFFVPITTRWMDNDVYGHINNVVYYSYFDTVINRYLIAEGGLDLERSEVIGLCVESGCQYLKPLAYPADVDAGVRVAHLGRASVRYEIGVFARGEDRAAAQGHFVHVFVSRASRRSVEIPASIRAALARIRTDHEAPR